MTSLSFVNEFKSLNSALCAIKAVISKTTQFLWSWSLKSSWFIAKVLKCL